MARPTPDLASCFGSGDMSCKEEDFGAPGEPAVQNPDAPSRARIAPQNIVWRLAGGRRTSSTGSANETVDGDMAVDVPVLRACFDPWRRDQPEDDHDGPDGRCQGCSKISKARAVAGLPHVPSRGECPRFLTCASPTRSWCCISPRTPTRPARSVPACWFMRKGCRHCATQRGIRSWKRSCVLRGVHLKSRLSGISSVEVPGIEALKTWGRESLQGRVLGCC
jgi:hypothetical protein